MFKFFKNISLLYFIFFISLNFNILNAADEDKGATKQEAPAKSATKSKEGDESKDAKPKKVVKKKVVKKKVVKKKNESIKSNNSFGINIDSLIDYMENQNKKSKEDISLYQTTKFTSELLTKSSKWVRQSKYSSIFYSVIDNNIEEYFGIKYMSVWAVGKYRDFLTFEYYEKYYDAYRKYLVLYYGYIISRIDGGIVNVNKVYDRSGYTYVSFQVLVDKDNALDLTFALRYDTSIKKYFIVDIILDKVSFERTIRDRYNKYIGEVETEEAINKATLEFVADINKLYKTIQ